MKKSSIFFIPKCPICNEKITVGKISNRQGTSTFFCNECCIEFVYDNLENKVIDIKNDSTKK